MDKFKHKKIAYTLISVAIIVSISTAVTLTLKSAVPKHVPETATPTGCPTGFITVPGNNKYHTKDFCVMKYEAKFVNGTSKSQADETPWVNISQTQAFDIAKRVCAGCHLITENEWLTIAQNVMTAANNWNPNNVGEGYIYSGHSNGVPANALTASTKDFDSYSGVVSSETKEITSDSPLFSQRRTLSLSNGQIIWDFSGNVAEWTAGQTTGGQPGLKNESGYAWKEWNAVNDNGYLTINPIPGYGNKLASVWNSQQGLGRLYSNINDDKIRAFVRGGSYKDKENAGIFSLDISNSPDYASPTIGFRVVKSLK